MGGLKTTIRGGCPELAQEQAARLVNEIEDKKLKELKDGVSLLKSKLEHLVHEEKLPWMTYVERYLEGGLAKRRGPEEQKIRDALFGRR